MKKVINVYNKRLIFPQLDFSIDTNEIKSVSETIFQKLVLNVWIKEVIPEPKKEVILKTQKLKKRKTKKRSKK